MHNERPEHTKKQNATDEITPNQEVIPRKTHNKLIVQEWGFWPKKTNKECTKAFQKIRQRRNTISNHKNGNIVQINQQKIAHETSKARRKTQQFRQAQKQRH